ncbi:Hypothetical predicted protein [Octopus vulgaris]|uniref:Uncharacterized protein n=1 Tax=Octopus vulgaris TaxID=6645 RepID=A0AA36F2C9_OCTVU|nr:Hypothetical predicted protein [Octopus vulgaris]
MSGMKRCYKTPPNFLFAMPTLCGFKALLGGDIIVIEVYLKLVEKANPLIIKSYRTWRLWKRTLHLLLGPSRRLVEKANSTFMRVIEPGGSGNEYFIYCCPFSASKL